MRRRDDLFRFLVFILVFQSIGCAAIMGRVTSGVADNLSAAVLAQDDILLVRDGAPAYLIAVDGLIAGSPKNQDLLMTGASLYGAYAGGFVEDPVRAARLTKRARDYGERALCVQNKDLCDFSEGPFDDFAAKIAKTKKKDLPGLYSYGNAWAGWITANSSDWLAIADIPKVQLIMERVVALDSEYENGQGHLYLGVLYTLRPKALGGRTEEGRAEFEQAIAISEGRNLMAQVFYARFYARLVFDRELHDQLLSEVLAADPAEAGYTLTNTIAQEQAAELLAGSEDYF